ncbi:ankyrin repeat protein, partial [Mariannaea sp. PMI_226]
GLRTALQAASAKGDMTRMRLLIERGAEVNSPAANFRGATALQYAVMGGFFRAMRLLIEEGADTNAPGAIHFGRTALEAAAEHGRIDMIKYLLLAGAETTGEYQWQYLRAVGFAKRRGHHAAAQLLENHRDWTDEDRAMCE